MQSKHEIQGHRLPVQRTSSRFDCAFWLDSVEAALPFLGRLLLDGAREAMTLYFWSLRRQTGVSGHGQAPCTPCIYTVILSMGAVVRMGGTNRRDDKRREWSNRSGWTPCRS